ncbi:hypothetical protein AVEN_217203-1 [Araneus ventricosus]|uniref:Uncharacterized protein n=1 Tax=Araneus ventricosus TaxID=182803 RepID=A0A4Y2TJC8_ARAVE|nr:hypothetical protein AVEN_217203-1 [Araneus ventricosus]
MLGKEYLPPECPLDTSLSRASARIHLKPRSYDLPFQEFRPRFAFFPVVGTGQMIWLVGLLRRNRENTGSSRSWCSLTRLPTQPVESQIHWNEHESISLRPPSSILLNHFQTVYWVTVA